MSLPITPSLWLAAAAPLAAVVVLLVGLRWKASSSASVGYVLAVIFALTLFQASLGIVALQSIKGVWDALLIAYIIAPALLLYEVSDEAGVFGTIRHGIEAITPNDLLHVLAFGWVLPSFLQAITGYGAPIAVAAPLLVAIGMKPVWAVAIPIIGHAWGKTFGTLAVAWEALTRVTDVPDPTLALVTTCIMLAVADLLAGVSIAWLYGRWQGIREAWPAVLIIAALHGIGQLIVALIAPNLAMVVPTALALVALFILAQSIYSEPSHVEHSPIMTAGASADISAGYEGRVTSHAQPMPFWLAFSPYLLLTALIMLVELVPFIGEPLASIRFGLPFPPLETGYGVVTAATEAYSEISVLTHPGTLMLVSAVVAFGFFRSGGYIPAGRFDTIGIDTIKTSIPTVMAVMVFVPLALVLEGSGMIVELATGVAQVASAPVYALLSPLIGAVGGFVTGSNLSANILFGPLQSQAAAALELNPAIVLAAQTAGAAIGASIVISAVLLGLGAVGAHGETGNTIRRMLPYVAITLLAIALIALAGTLILPVSGDASAAGR
jgi:lactate permease